MVAPGREARVGIKFLIGSAYGNDRDVSEEALIHGDIEFLDCLEGGGYRRSVVAACKLLAWYRVATDTEALYYGKVEDDHFVAVRALAADLRGLAGHARRGPLAYGLLQWLSYDGRRFWDARSDAWENATERAAALEDRGCFRGVACNKWDGPTSACPELRDRKRAAGATLGRRTIAHNPRDCAWYSRRGAGDARDDAVFPFMASGEVVSSALAGAVARCAYARAFVARAVRAVAPLPLDHGGKEFVPGVDALSGHFWRRCEPSRSLLLAAAPLKKFHNAPLPGEQRSRIALPPSDQSVVIHNLKFYDTSRDAPKQFLEAFLATRGENATRLPPVLLAYNFSSGGATTMAHGSQRAAESNVRMVVERRVFDDALRIADREREWTRYGRTVRVTAPETDPDAAWQKHLRDYPAFDDPNLPPW